MLQSGPQIVNSITNHQRPPQQGRRVANVNNKTMPGEFCVTLTGNHVGLTISPCLDFTLDGLSVFVRPPQLGEATFQIDRDVKG
jgi:hypothetical protein